MAESRGRASGLTATRKGRWHEDAGFTLIEFMIAGTAALLLMLPAAAMMRRTYKFVDAMDARFEQNEQARQMFAMLALGGAPAAAVGKKAVLVNTRGFSLVEGVRSRQALPGTWPLRGPAAPSQFLMTDGTLLLPGDALPPTTVQCTGNGVPLPDCNKTASINPQGWLGSDPVLIATGQTAAPLYAQPGRTMSFSFTVSDPRRAQRFAEWPAVVSETYRTMLTLNVDANP